MNKLAENRLYNASLQFRHDVKEGLTSNPKFLNSKYFYDKKGDALFQEIMKLPEYYLTACEMEILNTHKNSILEAISSGPDFFLVDLGAGDAKKTQILLSYFLDKKIDFTYAPVDISTNAIEKLSHKISNYFPKLSVKGIALEYIKALQSLPKQKRKFILFLGASIGNFSSSEAIDFLKEVQYNLLPEDYLFIGFDLKKEPEIILNAYNDKKGITKQFNLNLLERINREMGANFNTNNFEHSPYYDVEQGEARSVLISNRSQMIEIPALETLIHFKKNEPLNTEISKKYSFEEIGILAEETGFEVVQNLTDYKRYFTNSIWRKK